MMPLTRPAVTIPSASVPPTLAFSTVSPLTVTYGAATPTPCSSPAASIVAPQRPSRRMGLVTVTLSWYVPAQTITVPPAGTAPTAAWTDW